jgi:oligopeptidase B
MVESLVPFKGKVVLSVLRNGLPELEVFDLKTKQRAAIALPDPVHSVWVSDNRELDTPSFLYSYQSLTTPNTWFSYDFATKKSTLVKATPVPGGFDASRYVTERIEATAKDGTKVPISLVSKKGTPRDGSAPLYLKAYGSYGFPYPVTFSPSLLPILDRGVTVAIAHIRGGGELGKAWHEHGRLAEKMNTFTDFISCAEALVAGKYTTSSKLVIQGGSAGGLLMGAVTNLRPDLFQAVINDVPFVDVINTMNDATLPLTVTEYEEWGNPAKAEEYAWMRAYSPYDNLEKKAYPAMLVRSSYNDSQVMYWEPAKYVARMRALKTDQRPLYFHIRMEPAGHGGKSGRYEGFHEQADAYAFALWQMGLGPSPAQ